MTTETLKDIEQAEQARPIEVGDVFRYSWGYDQTNVQFYVVEKVTPKTVVVHECESILVESKAGGYDRVAPASDRPRMRPNIEWVRNDDGTHRRVELDPLPPEPMRKRVQTGHRGEPILVMDHGIATRVAPWSDHYQTAAGWGH